MLMLEQVFEHLFPALISIQVCAVYTMSETQPTLKRIFEQLFIVIQLYITLYRFKTIYCIFAETVVLASNLIA